MEPQQQAVRTINLTEVFLQKNRPEEDSFLWSATKTVGTGALYTGAAVALLGLMVLSGGTFTGAGLGGDDSAGTKKKSTEPDMVIHKPLSLSADQIVMAEPVSAKSAFGKAGAQTMIYADTGEKHYITQPMQYLQKLGCAI